MDAVKRMLAGALALLAVYLLLTGPLAARRAEAVDAARMRGVGQPILYLTIPFLPAHF